MDERQFYIEKPETKNITLVCPACRKEDSYPIRWIVRTKKSELPRGAGEEDKKRFALARSYMVRVDEVVAWGMCLGYGYVVGMLAGRVIARLMA